MNQHLLVAAAVVAGAGYLMTLAGFTKGALESRRTRRICPSCGRMRRDCSCRR